MSSNSKDESSKPLQSTSQHNSSVVQPVRMIQNDPNLAPQVHPAIVQPGRTIQTHQNLPSQNPHAIVQTSRAIETHQDPRLQPGYHHHYHPAIIAPRAMTPHSPKFSSKTDSRLLLADSPLEYQHATTVTSNPNFLPTHMDAYGNPVNMKREVRTFAEAGGFGGLASPSQCMVCKIPFGAENTLAAYTERIKLPNGTTQIVDINNTGAVEIAVRLPCGHVAGSNCILVYAYCPRCQDSLQYKDCGHKIVLHPTNPRDTAVKQLKISAKCMQCQVFDIEQRRRLPALLSQMAEFKAKQQSLGGEEARKWDRDNIQHYMHQIQESIAATEAEATSVIQSAEFSGDF